MRQCFYATVTAVLFTLLLYGCNEFVEQLPFRGYFDDSNLRSAVKAALAADPSLMSNRIEVTTKERVVYLNGMVDSEEQKQRAERIVFNVSGVRGLANHLQIQPAR